MAILAVNDLAKVFGKFVAVDHISFDLQEGEILGFLGRNGAGKTTTMQMLLGVLTATSGTVRYFDKDFFKHREEILEKVNFSTTYTHLPDLLTVHECLTFISYLYNIPDRKKRVNKIIETFEIGHLLKQQIHSLSAGQKTKINLAKAFINYPKVLLLDEPTASLDPDVAKDVRDFIQKQRKEFAVSIVFTSHNMAEVEEMCDRVIFIEKGKIIADDTPISLARRIKTSHLELLITDNIQQVEKLLSEEKLPFSKKGKHFRIDIPEKKIPDILRKMMDDGVVYNEISIEKPTLEDYFLQIAIGGNTP